jgi:hypothetical protein
MLTTKKRTFKLSECHVTADARRPDHWLLLELVTKTIVTMQVGSLKEVEEWLAVCVANGASSHHFAS